MKTQRWHWVLGFLALALLLSLTAAVAVPSASFEPVWAGLEDSLIANPTYGGGSDGG